MRSPASRGQRFYWNSGVEGLKQGRQPNVKPGRPHEDKIQDQGETETYQHSCDDQPSVADVSWRWQQPREVPFLVRETAAHSFPPWLRLRDVYKVPDAAGGIVCGSVIADGGAEGEGAWTG